MLRENGGGTHERRDRLKIFKNLSPMNLEETNMNEIWKTIEVRRARIKGVQQA